MNADDDLDSIDQEIRINELREAAREAAGGEMTSWENPDAPPEIHEQLWANVLEYERAEATCHFLQLEEAGVVLPPPEDLADEALPAKLWEVIAALARRDTFLSQTDHLSDRELYAHLWYDSLREFTPNFPPGSGWTHHIDLLGSGSDEDVQLHLKYYANESDRAYHQEHYPDEPLPAREQPPYNRDRSLPKEPSPQ